MVKGATTRILCVALSTTLLGGCGRALEVLGLRHNAKPEVNVRTASTGDAASAIAEGRAHLAAGRTGQAIEQFQRALATGQEIGPAANGMGVAYARLGQFEQAHRFFAEALAVDPKNEIYQANIGRLMRSSLLAERHETDFAARVAARTLTGSHDMLPDGSNAKVAAADEARDKVATTRAGLTRVSRGEVMIRTNVQGGTVGAGTLPTVGARGSKIDNFKPAVRIEFSDLGKAKSNDVPTADEVKDKAAEKTVSAGIEEFNPLVRFNLPSGNKR